MNENIASGRENEPELSSARFEEMTHEIIEAIDALDLGAGSPSLVNLAAQLRWHPKDSKPWAEKIAKLKERDASEEYPGFSWTDIKKLKMMLRTDS